MKKKSKNRMCLHCKKKVLKYIRRGLCFTCYHDKEIRKKYPNTKGSPVWRAAAAVTSPAPCEPIREPPGTEKKIEEMCRRVANKEAVFNSRDGLGVIDKSFLLLPKTDVSFEYKFF